MAAPPNGVKRFVQFGRTKGDRFADWAIARQSLEGCRKPSGSVARLPRAKAAVAQDASPTEIELIQTWIDQCYPR